MRRHVVICGYFSLKYKTNTAGDLIVLSVLKTWLESLEYTYDIVADTSIPNEITIPIEMVNLNKYNAMIFVCGPLADFELLQHFVQHFDGIKKIAINVSIVNENSKILELFDYIFPRDSKLTTNYDMSIEKRIDKRVPVVGLIYVGPQSEYSEQKHLHVEKIVSNVLEEKEIAIVRIDTKLPYNEYDLKSISEIISVISKMDFVITTRLHGSILSLKAHVPFISIDPISAGEKVTRQIEKVGWPFIINVDNLTKDALEKMIGQVLLPETKQLLYRLADDCLERYMQERINKIKDLGDALNE